MSTRSVIARKTPKGFNGRYHHWDGYPSGLGQSLRTIFRTHFEMNLKKFLKALISDQPSGWSTIIGRNWNNPTTILGDEMDRDSENESYEEFLIRRNTTEGPVGYKDRPWRCTHKNAANSGCEYAYVFEEVNNTPIMHILSSYCDPGGNCAGEKMIGMVGCGDLKSEWREIISINLLCEEEPDWKNIGELAKS